MKKLLASFIILFLGIAVHCNAFATSDIPSQVLEKAKKASVSISSRVAMSAYLRTGSSAGTGFISDKKNGLIITNNHLVGKGSIGNYYVTFHTGQQAEAKIMYYDIWQDFAILKVDPKDMPEDVMEILFSKEEPKLNQLVFIIGNNEGQDFSYHSGHISNLYEITGLMPQHSYIINLNSAGGSSGSPLLNIEGDAIGLNYGGGKTFAIVLKSNYVSNILHDIKANKKIQRRQIGVITNLYSLDKAVKHRHFSKQKMQEYLKEFPDARNRVITVDYTIAGSPAAKTLNPGDIIWEVNGEKIGASLYKFDHIMDTAPGNMITLTIYRNGKKLSKKINLYDVNKHKIDRMVDFAGAIFFEADDFTSAKSGIPLTSLTMANVQPGSSFSMIPFSFFYNEKNNYRLTPLILGDYKLTNLNDLIKAIPNVINQKYIMTEFKNFLPYTEEFNRTLISSQDKLVQDITFDNIDNNPRVLKYNPNTFEWESENITNKSTQQ